MGNSHPLGAPSLSLQSKNAQIFLRHVAMLRMMEDIVSTHRWKEEGEGERREEGGGQRAEFGALRGRGGGDSGGKKKNRFAVDQRCPC